MQTPQRGRQLNRDSDQQTPWPPHSPVMGPSSQPPSGPGTPSVAQVYDAMEKEQEAIVNKLQREITTLREDGTRSRSRSSSHSSTMSTMSMRPPEARRARPSVGEQDGLQSLRRENDLLRRKVAELTMKLSEKDVEIESLRRDLEK